MGVSHWGCPLHCKTSQTPSIDICPVVEEMAALASPTIQLTTIYFQPITSHRIYYDDLLIPGEYIACRGISDPFKYGLFEKRK